MSASLPIDVADAVVTELNGGTFSQTLNAVRHYRPQFELAELKMLRTSVVPKGMVTTSLGRTSNQHDVSVDVAVQKKVDPSDATALDGLMLIVGEVADFFRLRRLTALPAAIWSKTENVPIYAPEHLESKQVFTSVLTFTFRVVR